MSLLLGFSVFGVDWFFLKPFIVIGLAFGGVYALSGVGLVVLYRATGVLNLAFGAIGAAGALIAYYLVLAMPELRTSLGTSLRPLLRVFEAKYGFDTLYDGFVRRVVVGGSRRVLWQGMDAGLIDGLVNGVARTIGGWAEGLRPVQTGFVRHYALLILAGAVALVSYLLWS